MLSQKPSYNQGLEAESAQESQSTENSKFAKKLRKQVCKETDSKHTTPQPVKTPVLPRGPGSLPELQVELLHELQVTGGAQVVLPQASPRSDFILWSPLVPQTLAN